MKIFKYLVILLSFSLCTEVVGKSKKGKFTKQKEIKNSFRTNQYFNVDIINKFGEVRIETWDKNEVSYQINIISNGDNLDEVQDKIDDINIEVNESKSSLSLVTEIEGEMSSYKSFTQLVKGIFNGNFKSHNNKSSHIEINYILYVPKKSDLNILNDYGMIYLGEIKGKTEINSDYGGLFAKALLSDYNQINLDYSSKSDIMHLKKGDIKINYSTLHINHAGKIHLYADYSTTSIREVNTVDFNVDYGSIKITSAQDIVGNADYVQITLDDVSNIIDLDLNYGRLNITNINKEFSNVSIHSAYTHINIGIEQDEPYRLNMNVDYTKVEGLEIFEILERKDEFIRGYNISNNSNKSIDIHSDYGRISFTSIQ